MRKEIIYLTMFLFLITSVYAPNQLELLYPKQSIFKLDSTVEIHFNILNSTGYLLPQNQTTCKVHLYDNNNNQILNTFLSSDVEDYYFYINTSKIGRYQYNLWCNSTKEYGFVSDYYDINNDGDINPSENSILALLILIPLCLSILFIIGSFTLGKEHQVIKIFLFLLSPIGIIVALNYTMLSIVRIYHFTELQEVISSNLFWFVIVWCFLLAYFIIYGIYKMVKKTHEDKEELNY